MPASKVFATGVLSSTERTLLAMSAGGEIRSLNLINVGVQEQTILLYVKMAGETRRLYARVVRGEFERADVIDNALGLGVGDSLIGVTTSNGAVEYVITGQADR